MTSPSFSFVLACIEIFDINNEYKEFKNLGWVYKFPSVSDYKLNINKMIDAAMQKGNKLLILDDIDIMVSENSIPSQLLECIIRGRHRGIALILIFRRINTIHKQIVFNADHFFIFRSKFNLDIQYLQNNLGTDVSLDSLNKFEFLYMNAEDYSFKAKLNLKSDKLELVS